MRDHIKRHGISLMIVLGFLAAALVVFVYSGIYNIGADDHHSSLVFNVIKTLRDRSIEIRSAKLNMPNLDDPDLVLEGAGHYTAMCKECHLAPGIKQSELRAGMYPQPPNLSQARVSPRTAFWVIKHGIKMSAMPGWGSSHDDAAIWSMVAFLRKLPDLSPEEYKAIVAKAPPDEDADGASSGDHAHHH